MKESIYVSCKYVAIGAVYKRESWNKTGGFDENSMIEDWEMWANMESKNMKIHYIKDSLVFYRRTNSNISSNVFFMLDGAKYILKKYESFSGANFFPIKVRQAVKTFLQNKNYSYAFKVIKKYPTDFLKSLIK